LVKLASVVYMAAWLTSKGDRVRDFKKVFFPFGIIVGVIAILIIRQPDLGTTVVVSTSMFCVYFIAGADLLPMAGAGRSQSALPGSLPTIRATATTA
jgi:cell division protein FtsW